MTLDRDARAAQHPAVWRVVARRMALDARPWLRGWFEDIALPDGRVIENFVSLEMPDVAVVVALTSHGDVVVERGYKHGPRRACVSLPAGYVESGEEPLDAARRELREETGYVSDDWVPLGRFTADGNRGGGVSHLYLAQASRLLADPDAHDLETVTVDVMPFSDLLSAVRSGDVAVLSNAAAIGLAAVTLRSAQEGTT